ncbi:HNH endonuclease [Halosimplex litoreum]|uniref:HNH endonuclease n=1 Tax=Halosimplex litoreum TaxID=1198301 RepID=A0A7T3FVT0_9EURY|nr:HNH endonuclease [Halosimplex litoreum]QPV61578.1 HNH endonuclease [Halosimplex litoreum]
MPPEDGKNSRTDELPPDPIFAAYPVTVDEDDRYPTAVRFLGGASDRFANLVAMCKYISTEAPTKTDLRAWFETELDARESTFDKQVPFIEDLGLISLPEATGVVYLTETGDRFLTALDEPGERKYEILFDALRATVIGFDYLLARLAADPIPLDQLDTILAEAYVDYQPDDAVAIKHYTWLLAIGYVEKHDGAYELTDRGRRAFTRIQPTQHADETEPPTPEAIDTSTLTDEEQRFVEQRRRVRDTAFRRRVRAAYDNRCAICGRNRTTPDGTPEVEAAHIYPKGAGGRDIVPNGLALCKLHHWAFDSGWLSMSDEYEVLVTDAPDQPGYAEFSELEGTTLHLPANESQYPAVKFLQKHRRLYGFTAE